jgi:hypothetical protein
VAIRAVGIALWRCVVIAVFVASHVASPRFECVWLNWAICKFVRCASFVPAFTRE